MSQRAGPMEANPVFWEVVVGLVILIFLTVRSAVA